MSTNVCFVGGDVQCKSDEISQVNRAKLAREIKSIRYILKGHSHLWDRADLDASFHTLKRVYRIQPEIRASVKPVTVNTRDGQNVMTVTEARRICHVAVTDFQ